MVHISFGTISRRNRLRVGGRTYFGPNDAWRLQGYTAYGFDDDKFKYGLSGNGWSIRKENYPYGK
jgi:hypothetical protein